MRPLLAAAAALLLATATACAVIVRERTLPPSIRVIHVPMADNRTAEPGLEEELTKAVQREFMADGRLDQARQLSEADAVLRLSIVEYEVPAFSFDADDFPTVQEYRVRVNIRIEENIPGRPMIGGQRRVDVRLPFNADPRTTTFDPEPRNRERLIEQLARAVVLEVIAGEFEGMDDPPPTNRPARTSISIP